MIQLASGDIVLYSPKGIDRQRLVVVISAQGVLDSGRRFFTGLTVEASHNGDPMSIPITTPDGRRYVDTTRPKDLIRDWVVEGRGALSAAELAAVRAMRTIAEDL